MGHGVFQSVATFVAACSKHVAKASKKLLVPSGNSSSGKVRSNGADQSYQEELYRYNDVHQPSKLPPPSPLKTPPRSPLHQILSRKTSPVPFLGDTEKGKEEEDNLYYDDYWEDGSELDKEETTHAGDDGVWRKTILKGEKCEPLDFSGVIYYDNDGRRVERDGKQGKVDVVGGDGRDRSYQVGGGNPSSAANADRQQPAKLPPPPVKSPVSTPRAPLAPRSPLHQILSRKSSLVPFLGKKKKQKEEEEQEERYYDAWEDDSDAEEDMTTTRGGDVDDGGVWRKNILMGEKCEPLDFSGVIYYDNEGRRLDGVPPRSPRHPMAGGANPLPSFTFPVIIEKAQDGHAYSRLASLVE